MTSTLTKSQTKTFGPKAMKYGNENATLTVKARFDDECGNGHNTFAITGEIRVKGRIEACGCLHEDIARVFPSLAPLLKWHLTATDGPMHYVANTVYHALEHGPTHAWIYYAGPNDPKGIGGHGERLLGYEKADKARGVEGVEGYRVLWDDTTAKVRNLDYARSTAVWPDATDEELMSPTLAIELQDRLDALLAEFREAMESAPLEFTW